MKIYDSSGALLENPDMSAGYLEPREVVHHAAVSAVTHEAVLTFPGGRLTHTVTDTPAKPAWDEVVSYTYHLHPPDRVDEVQAQLDTMQADNDAAHDDVYAAITELGDLLCGLL